MIESSDHFQFGSGKPIAAAERAYIPIEMEGQETKGLLFGVSVLSTNIPFWQAELRWNVWVVLLTCLPRPSLLQTLALYCL
jgi:hypothetical protein